MQEDQKNSCKNNFNMLLLFRMEKLSDMTNKQFNRYKSAFLNHNLYQKYSHELEKIDPVKSIDQRFLITIIPNRRRFP